jgi:hypothetical protein
MDKQAFGFQSGVGGLVSKVKSDIYLYNQDTSIITFYTLVLSHENASSEEEDSGYVPFIHLGNHVLIFL